MERVLPSGRWAVHLNGGLIQPDVSIPLLKLGFTLSKDFLIRMPRTDIFADLINGIVHVHTGTGGQ